MIRALGILVFLLSFVLSSTGSLFSQSLDREEMKMGYLNSGAYPGVQVTGALPSSETMRYTHNTKAVYYIELSGGSLPHADKKQMRVIRADGQALSNGKARSQKIGLGDIVMVPSKIKRDKNVTPIPLTSISIISSITLEKAERGKLVLI